MIVTIAATVVLASAAPGAPKPKVEPTAAAQKRARAITLGQRDFPAGWKPDPQWTQGSPLDLFGPLCRGVSPKLSGATIVGWHSSRHDLVAGQHAQIAEQGILLFATAAQAKRMYALFALPWATRCMAAGRNYGATRITSARPFRLRAAGAHAAGFRYVLTNTSAPKLLYADAIFLRAGAGFAMFVLIGDAQPFDKRVEGQIVRAVAARMALGTA